jgi:hypothetical protein
VPNDFTVPLDPAAIASWLVAAATATNGRAPMAKELVAVGVQTGIDIGKRLDLEPLDDGLRTVIEGALEIVRKRDPGMVGLIHNLERLDAWLQRYPTRGRGSEGNLPPR